MTYALVLIVHSWLRWVVLTLGVGLLGVALRGWRHGEPGWPDHSEVLRKGFLAALDTQMLLGIALYGLLSPLSRAGRASLPAAMADPVLRFYTIEHAFGMVVAIALAHVGLARARRREGVARYRIVVVTQALWLVVTLLSVPWPGLAYGRPFFRLH